MIKLFRGRLNRKNYILSLVVLFVLGIILIYFLIYPHGSKDFFAIPQHYPYYMTDNEVIFPTIIRVFIFVLLQFLFAMVGISIGIRRLHDLGKSGLYLLFSLIPFVAWIILIYFMIVKGERKSNKYGEQDMRPFSIMTLINL